MGSIVVMCYFYQGWKASHKAYLWTIFERCEYVDTVHGQRREPAYFSFFCTTRVSSGCPENGISPWKKQVLMNALCVAFFPPDCALHMCRECIQIKWWTLMMKILKKLSFLILKTFQVQVQKGKQTNSCVCNYFFSRLCHWLALKYTGYKLGPSLAPDTECGAGRPTHTAWHWSEHRPDPVLLAGGWGSKLWGTQLVKVKSMWTHARLTQKWARLQDELSRVGWLIWLFQGVGNRLCLSL